MKMKIGLRYKDVYSKDEDEDGVDIKMREMG